MEKRLQVLRGKDVNEQKTKARKPCGLEGMILPACQVEAPKISIKTSNKISTQRPAGKG